MDKVTLNFGPPEHGWSTVDVSCGRQKCSLIVSDVPVDSIGDLVRSLVRVAAGSEAEQVEWSLEPGYAYWQFEVQNSNMSFSIVLEDRELLRVTDDRSRMLVRLCRQLLALPADPAWSTLPEESRWSWELPVPELAALRSMLFEASGDDTGSP